MATRGVNKVILVGHLGNEPEVRYMPNGNAVANITLATSEGWRDKATGEQREKTEWHRVVLFGKLAEVAKEYLHKGSQVYIEGQLQTRKWQDQSGQDRYTTEIVVQGYNGIMQMLGGRSQGNQAAGNNFGQSQQGYAAPAHQSNNAPMSQNYGHPQQQTQNQQSFAQQQPQQQPAPQSQQFNDMPDFDDDIPF